MPGLAGGVPNVYSIPEYEVYNGPNTPNNLLNYSVGWVHKEGGGGGGTHNLNHINPLRLSTADGNNQNQNQNQTFNPNLYPHHQQYQLRVRTSVSPQLSLDSEPHRVKHSFPSGVLLVSPCGRAGSLLHENNRVAPSPLPIPIINSFINPTLAYAPDSCYNNTCRYREKFHKKFGGSLNLHEAKKINIYEHIVYPETEVLKMEKIANFRERVSVSHVEMPRKDIWKSLGAEFLGTFILMVVGCGVGLYIEDENKPNIVHVALCWGLVVATLAQSLGHVSGCHMNPAVTIAMLVTRKIELVKAGLYIITQCIAAIVGIAVLKAMTPEKIQGGFGVITLDQQLSSLQGFGIEFIMTFVLLITIFSVSDENRTDIQGSTPLAIGLCISSLILFGGKMTGAALNPARALGPAVVMGIYDFQWVYWVGPIGGAITAAAVYEHIFRNLRPDEIEAAELAKQLKVREAEAKDNGMAPPV